MMMFLMLDISQPRVASTWKLPFSSIAIPEIRSKSAAPPAAFHFRKLGCLQGLIFFYSGRTAITFAPRRRYTALLHTLVSVLAPMAHSKQPIPYCTAIAVISPRPAAELELATAALY